MTSMTIPTLELADQAAQAVRELNHRTRGAGTFTGPAEIYRLVAELALLVGGIPQLLGQLDQWLHNEHHAGHLRTDNRTDPSRAVRDAAAQLTDAGDAANDLAQILVSAQQCLAHLGATKPTAPPTKGVSFQPLKGGQSSTAVDKQFTEAKLNHRLYRSFIDAWSVLDTDGHANAGDEATPRRAPEKL